MHHIFHLEEKYGAYELKQQTKVIHFETYFTSCIILKWK